MKKDISLGLAVLFFCSSILAQTTGKLNNKICYPAMWLADSAFINTASKKQNILLDKNYSILPEFYTELMEKEIKYHYKWPVLYIPKAGSFIEYDKNLNAICDTHTLDNPPQFPIKMYKGLKLHMKQ